MLAVYCVYLTPGSVGRSAAVRSVVPGENLIQVRVWTSVWTKARHEHVCTQTAVLCSVV